MSKLKLKDKNSSVYDFLDNMVTTIEKLREEAEKVDGGNKAACTRLRVGLLGVSKDCKFIRERVLEIKKS